MCRNDFTTKQIPIQLFRYPGLLSLIGLGLGIKGGVVASYSSNPFDINAYSKAAIIIFIAVYLVVIAILVLLIMRVSQVKKGERRLLIVVTVCSPFIAARLLYALLSDFAESHLFNSTFGNLTIYLCMAVIEEIIVVIICVAVGFTLDVVPKEVDETRHDLTSMGGDNTGKETQGNLKPASRQKKRSGGLITWLYRTIRDYIRSKRSQDA
jgi:chromate transport protein ChrA